MEQAEVAGGQRKLGDRTLCNRENIADVFRVIVIDEGGIVMYTCRHV